MYNATQAFHGQPLCELYVCGEGPGSTQLKARREDCQAVDTAQCVPCTMVDAMGCELAVNCEKAVFSHWRGPLGECSLWLSSEGT